MPFPHNKYYFFRPMLNFALQYAYTVKKLPILFVKFDLFKGPIYKMLETKKCRTHVVVLLRGFLNTVNKYSVRTELYCCVPHKNIL